jgi:hypothetical protein
MSLIFPKSPQIKFQPTGKWDEATQLIKRLDPGIKEASVKAQWKMCEEILKKVKKHMIKQDLGWSPLNDKYVRLKKKLGRDRRILIATKDYYDNIMIWKRANGWKVYIGVKPGIFGRTLRGKRAKEDIATIAAIHEFSRGRRRRPLWNPTIREMGNTKGFKKLYLDNFEKELRKAKLGKYLHRLKAF